MDCLEHDPEDRPSAVEVLGRLEEVGQTVPYSCTETKLELIKMKDALVSRKEEEIQRIRVDHQRQLSEREAEIHRLQEALHTEEQEHQQQIRRIEAEKQEQIEEMTTQHQQQLDDQSREIEQLLGELRSLTDASKKGETGCVGHSCSLGPNIPQGPKMQGCSQEIASK